jgi:hypothetical protein
MAGGPRRGEAGVAGSNLDQARSLLVERLRARCEEIEQATLTRVFAVSELRESVSPEYAHGLRASVSAALEHGLAALGRGDRTAPAIPTVLLAQARLAARNGIRLDTVLRRYLVGYTLLGDFLLQEVERSQILKGPELQRLFRSQARLFDALLAAISEEYSREEGARLASNDQRRADKVRRLLGGELLDSSDLPYDFDAYHLGLIASGAAAEEALRGLAVSFDCRALVVHREEGSAWGWLGARRPLDPGVISERPQPADVTIAVGEPAQGIAGWRLTHRQARAALPVALSAPNRHARYSEVALLASMLRDDLLVSSLREIYLAPLDCERDGGETARRTLRAYFAAARNISSAAAALGVSRQAVGRRLRAIEERLGRPLSACAAEIEAALRLEDDRVPEEGSRGALKLSPSLSVRPVR